MNEDKRRNRKPDEDRRAALVDLDTKQPIWDRFFMVAPLVLVGTVDEDGAIDLAPKHMVTPMGWQNYFGFVCSPRHATSANIDRTGEFTVSFPKPEQILYSSLAASPRVGEGDKPVIGAFETEPAEVVGGAVLAEASLYFECRHERTVDGFGDNCLITGEIVAARIDRDYLRSDDVDDQDLLRRAPVFAYLAPGRFAGISDTHAFPFPADMRK